MQLDKCAAEPALASLPGPDSRISHARRVEVVDPTEIRIMGSKTELLRTLAAAASVEPAVVGVRSFIPKWRTGEDETRHRYVIAEPL
jgi:hypothetical protein